MSDVTDRGEALLARMEKTDSVSFYGARTVIRELCVAVKMLEIELENVRAMGEAAYNSGNT